MPNLLRKRSPAPILLLLVFLAIHRWVLPHSTTAREPPQVAGRVISVADGDTLTVLTTQNQQIRVRLADIDAPEKGQDFGAKSKQALSEMVFGQHVYLEGNRKDRFERTIATVYLPHYPTPTNVNLAMVSNGFAWHYTQFSRNTNFAKAQEAARAARKGLWSLPNPIPPWEFRRPTRSN